MSKRINYILSEIEKIFPNPETELKYENPFQLLVAVVLSAQTTDKQVNKVTQEYWLFEKIKSPIDVINMWQNKLKEGIKSIWLTNSKAKNIYSLSLAISNLKPESDQEKEIYDKYWYVIPSSIAWLVKLDWVWEKTAKVVASVLYDIPCVPVDTHVHRVTNRLWIAKANTPLSTSRQLEKTIPDNLKNKAHHLFIFFGRYFCLARSPKCNDCPLQRICKYYNKKNN